LVVPFPPLSINETIGTKYLLTRHRERGFVLNRLVFMSALPEIPQPLGKLKGKAAVITGATTGDTVPIL
jgi:hypothetical protein